MLAQVLDNKKQIDRRYEIPNRLGMYLSEYLTLPGLRACWPMSSINAGGDLVDLSAQARTLTAVGTPGYAVYNNQLLPYSEYDGATQYHHRATEAGLAITGELTLMAWLWADVTANMLAFSKWDTTGNQRSYGISLVNTDQWRANLSTDGTAVVTADSAVIASNLNTWHFVWMRFFPSTALDISVDGVTVSNTTAIPASIFVSTADLILGGGNAGAEWDGRATYAALCAVALSDTRLDKLWRWGRGLFGV